MLHNSATHKQMIVNIYPRCREEKIIEGCPQIKFISSSMKDLTKIHIIEGCRQGYWRWSLPWNPTEATSFEKSLFRAGVKNIIHVYYSIYITLGAHIHIMYICVYITYIFEFISPWAATASRSFSNQTHSWRLSVAILA